MTSEEIQAFLATKPEVSFDYRVDRKWELVRGHVEEAALALLAEGGLTLFPLYCEREGRLALVYYTVADMRDLVALLPDEAAAVLTAPGLGELVESPLDTVSNENSIRPIPASRFKRSEA